MDHPNPTGNEAAAMPPNDDLAPSGAPERARAPGLAPWLPLAGLVLLAGLAVAMGWHRLISLETVGQNYEALKGFIAGHFAVALLIYMALYVAVVALSLPGALIMTVSGGLLFGWQIATPATVVAATLGATIVFMIAKSSLGAALAARAGPWLAKLRDGFAENALSYLLFLRLVPAFPFFIVNLAPALLGVPLKTFVLGTALGIIPGTAAFCAAGAGLASVVEAQNASHRACLAKMAAGTAQTCPYEIDTSALVTKELLVAFALLGVAALIPVALKTWSKHHAKG